MLKRGDTKLRVHRLLSNENYEVSRDSRSDSIQIILNAMCHIKFDVNYLLKPFAYLLGSLYFRTPFTLSLSRSLALTLSLSLSLFSFNLRSFSACVASSNLARVSSWNLPPQYGISFDVALLNEETPKTRTN